MNRCGPLMVVATVPAGRAGGGRLVRLAQQLRRRGLKVHRIRTLGDAPLGECDILLVSCDGQRTAALAEELDHLWTQKWNRWYAEARHA